MATPPTKVLGDAAQARALAYLVERGLVPVQRNYRVARGPSARGGEVDLIARDRNGTLVFAEGRAGATPTMAVPPPASEPPSSSGSSLRQTTTGAASAPRRRAGSMSSASMTIVSSGFVPPPSTRPERTGASGRFAGRERGVNRLSKWVSYDR